MDAGERREALTSRARSIMANNADVCCYSDLWKLIEQDVVQLSKKIGKPTGYVMACLIDDIQNLGD